MKILLVHNYYKSRYIGGEDLVFNREVEALKKELGQENLFVYSVYNDNVNPMKLLLNMYFSLSTFFHIYKIIKKNKIDIIHIHNFFPLLSGSVFIAGKLAGVKVINTLHNYRWWCIGGIFFRDDIGICEECIQKGKFFSGVKYACFRNSRLQSFVAMTAFYIYKKINIFKYIDYFFVLTEFQKNKILELGVKKEKIIVKPNFNENSLVQNYQLKDKKDYIFVGRLEESKGILELLNVWEKLDETYKLNIIGDGPLKEEILKLNLQNINYHGKLENKKVLEEISKAKYLIQPSILYETFGLTIIEAFKCGTPVIGFDIGTRGNFITDEETGFLAKDKKDLKIIIENSLNYSKYDGMIKKCIEKSHEYSEDRVLKEQIRIYEGILGRDKK